MQLALAAVGVPVFAIALVSAVRFARKRTGWSLLELIGALLLAVMILTHVAERFRLLPAMGWGRPNSIGHYIDLTSAVLGLILLPLGYICGTRAKHGGSK